MKLTSCIKVVDGRCVHPETTVQRLERILGARYDYRIVEEQVADHLHWTALFVDELGFRAMGKGTSRLLSRAGALAEAAEWLTACPVDRLPGYLAAHEARVPQPRLSIGDLLPHIDPADASARERIRELDTAQYWADGWSLRDRRRLSVPLEYARLISGPNGIAAGNRIEEAVVHAANEVFERRTQITVLRNRMILPTIDAESIDDAVVREQLAFLRNEGLHITIKDLSFGGVLPCVGVYLRDPAIPRDYQFHHFFKVGASFDRAYALQRALTEFAQGRRRDEFIRRHPERRPDVLRHDFRALRSLPADGDNFLSAFMFGFVPLQDAAFLEAGDVVPFERGQAFSDCLDDIREAVDICETLDRDIIVVDRTDPDIGFPVVQVIVPGYSDVLPYHPATSPGLFRTMTRKEVLASYDRR